MTKCLSGHEFRLHRHQLESAAKALRICYRQPTNLYRFPTKNWHFHRLCDILLEKDTVQIVWI